MVKLFLNKRLFGNNYGTLEFLAKLETLFGGVPLVVYQLQIVFAKKEVHVDEVCLVCHASGETATHLLFECPVANHCWLLSSLNFNGCHGRSCFEWFYSFFASHSADDCSLMMMSAGWMLWKNMNDIVWRGKRNSAHFLVNLASRMLYE